MTRKIVSFEDFSKGEFGLLGEAKAPNGMITGKNVVKTLDGAIVPRSGLVSLAPTGLGTGEINGFGYHLAEAKLWFVLGTTVYQFSTSGTGQALTNMGSLADTPSNRLGVATRGIYSYITSRNDKSYVLDHNGGTLTALSSAPGGLACAVYNDRLVIGGGNDLSDESRVRYSAPARQTFSVYPESNVFKVGEWGTAVCAILAHRGHLTIVKDDGTWFRLDGPLPAERHHRLLTGLRPGTKGNLISRVALTAADEIWFAPMYGDYPVRLSGAGLEHFEHLSLTNNGATYNDTGLTPKVGVTGLLKPGDVLFSTGRSSAAYDNQALLFHRGMWTKHLFDVNVSGFVEGTADPQSRAFFCDGGASGATPKFYAWSYDLNRPPISGNTFESLGDASSTPPACEFSLPEWWTKDQSEIQPIQVIVDFKKWAHGYAADNTFTVTLTPLRKDGSGDGTARSLSWTEAAASSSSSGTADREKFSFGTNLTYAHGFRLKISAMVGVAIQRIHVVYDSRPVQSV